MRKIISIIILLFLFGSIIQIQSGNDISSVAPFKAGESLTYTMKYGPLHGGNATLTLRKTAFRDKEAFHARIYARTVGLTDRLFKVRDIYESIFDPVSCLPYKSVRDISEGGYTFYNEVFFYHQDKQVNSKKSGMFNVPEGILDMVSTLYYIRNYDYSNLQAGDVIDITTFFSDEIFPFLLRYKGIEEVKTKLGRFMCHRFDPVVEPGRIFKTENDMTFWLTNDRNLIPIRVKFDMIVGSVKCDLQSYENLNHELKGISE